MSDQAMIRDGGRVRRMLLSSDWTLLLVGILTAVLCMPFFRLVLISDEGVLLNGAERMLRGEKIYVDFFEFLPPMGFLLTEAWFRIVGISFESMRALAALTMIGIACFTYLACRRACQNAALSAVLAIGWIVVVEGWVQVSHHLLTTAFSMAAVWAALADLDHGPRRLQRPLMAGAAAGLAMTVTPHRGALTALAGLTGFMNLKRRPSGLMVYVLGCGLAPAAVLAFLLGNHALTASFDDAVRFTLTRYPAIQSVPFGYFVGNGGGKFPYQYIFVFPPAALSLFYVLARDWRTCIHDSMFRRCLAFAVAGLVGCFPRPDLTRIGYAAPLVCPLLALCIISIIRQWRPYWWRYRYPVVAAGGVLIGLITLTVEHFLLLSREALRAEIIATPRGKVAFFGEPAAPELLARIEATPSFDAYFFYPTLGIFSFLTAREQVSKYDIFMPGYTTPSQYRDACVSVMRRASWVVIDRRWDPSFLREAFPAMRDPEPTEKKQFERALETGFDLLAQVGTLELRRRREGVSNAVCGSIVEES